MAELKIGIIGAGGRMGQANIRQVIDTDDCILVAASDMPGTPQIGRDAGETAGKGIIGVEISDDTSAVIAASDAVIEFTLPNATVEHAQVSAEARVAHIIGTTGLNLEQEQQLKAAGDKTVIMHAPNMSLAVNLLIALTKQVARTLDDDFDIEIFEMHHKHKVDAPSGTAISLGQAAAEGRQVELNRVAQWTRQGNTGERAQGSIGFATLRGGNVVGDHTAIFATEDERLELTHKAQSRQIFSRGAVHAALWSRGKTAGYYTMFDVLGIDY